jgi:hypothetical protein
MWHGVAHVTNDYDTILYESPEPSNVLVLNAGPGNVDAQAWSEVPPYLSRSLRSGSSYARVISGCLADLSSGLT